MAALWLIGGTSESRDLVNFLLPYGISLVITVTTPTAARLYPQHSQIQVRVGCLDPTNLLPFITNYHICGIIDASHPYATVISQGAIALSQAHDLPYLRYERQDLEIRGAIAVPDWATLLAGDCLQDRRVLFIVGYRPLAQLAPWQDRGTFFARILPSAIALNAALAAGFTPDRLIALRPPITPPLELALWQQWGIDTVVSKASGTPGGQEVKEQVAQALGVRLLILQRPEIAYPQQTRNPEDILKFCTRCLAKNFHG